MAPEQRLGRPADARSDQFSFCVTLYEALYGELPFDGRGDDYARNVVHGRRRNPPAGSDVPRWLRLILLRGLSVAAGDRFGSMDELLAVLRDDPGIARRRWLGVAGGAVLLLGAGLGLRHARPAAEPPCHGAERKLAGVWDDERKHAVHAAFVATGGANAEDAYARTAGALDDYARGWVAMHTDACEATQVRGEQSAEMLDLRVECLGEHLEELRAQVDVFTHADAATVSKSVQAARALPRVQACADAAALRAPVRPPSDEQKRARVDGLPRRPREGESRAARGAIRRARSRERPAPPPRPPPSATAPSRPKRSSSSATCKTTRGTTRPRSARSAARSPRRSPGATKRRGRARSSRSSRRWDFARRASPRGTSGPSSPKPRRSDRAIRSSKASSRGTRGASTCARTSTTKRARRSRSASRSGSRRWARRTTPWPVRSPTSGNVFFLEGKADAARAQYTRSLAITENVLGPESPSLAPNLNNLGELSLGRGDDEAADKSLERARALWERALGPDHPKVALALYNLARTRRAEGDLVTSEAMAERALAIWQKALPAEHPDVALGMHGVAEGLRAKGDYAGALAEEEKSLAMREKIFGPNGYALAESLVSIGETRLAEGLAPVAIAPLTRAVTILETRPESATDLGRGRFDLAKALARSDEAKSRATAEEAREAYARGTGRLAGEKVAEIDAWLAGH